MQRINDALSPRQQKQQYQSLENTKTILDDNSLTIAEKLINIRKADINNKKSKSVSMSGDIVIVSVDLAMAQDSTGPLAIRSLNEMGIHKLYDPSKVLLVIDNINTDIIIPFRFKSRTNDPYEMAKYAMYGYDPNFHKKISNGDVIVAGRNFGGGSSREQAPGALKYAGICDYS